MVQIHSPRPLFKKGQLAAQKDPDDILFVGNKSVGQMRSHKHLHFLLQIGVKWRDAATTFPHFIAHAQSGPA
jgi:hypothetical protein